MFVIKTDKAHGYMVVHGCVDQNSAFSDARFTFSLNIDGATVFGTASRALGAAAEYGQRRERVFPLREIPKLLLFRVKRGGLQLVEEII